MLLTRRIIPGFVAVALIGAFVLLRNGGPATVGLLARVLGQP